MSSTQDIKTIREEPTLTEAVLDELWKDLTQFVEDIVNEKNEVDTLGAGQTPEPVSTPTSGERIMTLSEQDWDNGIIVRNGIYTIRINNLNHAFHRHTAIPNRKTQIEMHIHNMLYRSGNYGIERGAVINISIADPNYKTEIKRLILDPESAIA